MDLSKLESMSSDALRAIRDKTIEVLATRTDNQLRTGSIAWFKDKEGNKRYVKITRANPKSMSAVEVDPVTHGPTSTTTWRIGRALLNVVSNPGVKKVTPPAPIVPHRITTAAPSSW
jgi:hypothetical protein